MVRIVGGGGARQLRALSVLQRNFDSFGDSCIESDYLFQTSLSHFLADLASINIINRRT